MKCLGVVRYLNHLISLTTKNIQMQARSDPLPNLIKGHGYKKIKKQ